MYYRHAGKRRYYTGEWRSEPNHQALLLFFLPFLLLVSLKPPAHTGAGKPCLLHNHTHRLSRPALSLALTTLLMLIQKLNSLKPLLVVVLARVAVVVQRYLFQHFWRTLHSSSEQTKQSVRKHVVLLQYTINNTKQGGPPLDRVSMYRGLSGLCFLD